VKITNQFDLPESFLRFDQENQYTKGGADFSVTELIDSPRISRLKKLHDEEIEEDISDMVMAILGTAVHSILEQGAPTDSVVEERLSMVVDGVTISGGIDLQTPDLDGWIISDYKTVSAFALQANPEGKLDWTRQLNIYYALAEANGRLVNGLEVIAIVRDWSKSGTRRSRDYPQHAIVRIPIPMWDQAERDDYIRERVASHTAEELPECTAAERWARPTKYAVLAKGLRRAKKLCDSMEEAEAFASELNVDTEVEVRQGANIRCEGYCPAATHCQQWQKLQEKFDE